MTNEEKAESVKDYFARASACDNTKLAEALHTFNELRLWPDDADSVSIEQALQCWAIVSTIADVDEMPDSLKM